MSIQGVVEQGLVGDVTVTVSWAETLLLYTSAHPAAQFRGEVDRFEAVSPGVRPGEPVPDRAGAREAARLVRLRRFNDGSIGWCETYLEALVLCKALTATGHEAHLLWDRTGRGGYAVLTSLPLP